MSYLVFFVAIFGLIIGSFLNVVIYRLYAKESFGGRSRCTVCKTTIAWYDNIPIASYVLLSGKCRSCDHAITPIYPIVEGATAVFFTLAYYALQSIIHGADVAMLLVLWVFIAFLIVIFVYDLKWYLILDVVTIPAMVVAFVANVLLGHVWWNLLLGAALGGGFFLIQFLISRGRWIGGGDIRLGVVMGLMLGYPMILVALMVAYIGGTIISLPLVAFGKKRMGDKIPFGTFLSAATVITLLYGDEVLKWYLSFFNV